MYLAVRQKFRNFINPKEGSKTNFYVYVANYTANWHFCQYSELKQAKFSTQNPHLLHCLEGYWLS